VRFKIDENLPPEASILLRKSGHDSLTVWDQGLQGRPDTHIATVCQEERRILITLDLDFADIRTYPPNQYCGLIVMRLSNQSRTHVLRILQGLLPILKHETVEGRLWIVGDTAVRIHGEKEEAL
jgi:predicted nuclease of predicted toxin-antitoxin system